MTDSQAEFLTVAQAAALLPLSRATIRRCLRTDTLPGLKLKRAWRIHHPQLVTTLEQRARTSAGANRQHRAGLG